MDAIVIGGGIGGSVLALALHASSVTHRIRVFEAASEMRALGIGIHIGAHAMKELSALGLEDALVATSCQPEDYAFFTRHGQLVYREPWGLAAGHQWPHLSLHRGDLHQVLLDAVRDRIGAENFITGHRCSAVEQDEAGVTAHFVSPDDAALASETGDILVRIDDQPIDGIDALHRLLDADRIGRRAELALIRRDRQLTVSLVPTELAAA